MAIWNARPSGSEPRTSRVEIISRLPAHPRLAPPLLFVHGGWHAAWCWEDHFLDYFSKRGFACYALNLRGHGLSQSARDVRFVRIRHFVDDVREAVDLIGGDPIIIGHSLGGFVVQKYLETRRAELGVLLASVPPNGAFRMVRHVARLQPFAMLHSNLVFSLRPLFSDAKKVRNLLFTDRTPESIVQDCLARLQDDTILGLPDYLFLDLVKPAKITTKMLIFGAAEDRMIDAADIERTGRAYGQHPVVLPGLGHDMMIDQSWERAAEAVAIAIDRHLGTDADTQVRSSKVA